MKRILASILLAFTLASCVPDPAQQGLDKLQKMADQFCQAHHCG